MHFPSDLLRPLLPLSMARLASAVSVLAFAAAATSAVAQRYPVPPAWPAQHTHKEAMFTPALDQWNQKTFHYDFTHMALRVDSLYVAGLPIPPFNFSSYWLGNTLYMYTFDSPSPSCVSMDMGFGMMRPDWFTDGIQQNATIWIAQKSNALDTQYHNTVWTRKCATCDSDPNGYFDMFTLAGNGTDVAGTCFRMQAPGPLPILYVVNEYSDFVTMNYTALDATFALPSTPACKATDIAPEVYASLSGLSDEDKAVALKEAKVAHLEKYMVATNRAFPELYMALV